MNSPEHEDNHPEAAMTNKSKCSWPNWYNRLSEFTSAAQGIDNMLQRTLRVMDSKAQTTEEALKSMFPELLSQMNKLNATRDECSQAINLATYKAATGHPLTRDEYFLMKALNVVNYELCRDGFDEFRVYSMFCVKRTGGNGFVINPEAFPDQHELQNGKSCTVTYMGAGIAPEEVSLAELRAEQVAFFREHMPEVYSRFKP